MYFDKKSKTVDKNDKDLSGGFGVKKKERKKSLLEMMF